MAIKIEDDTPPPSPSKRSICDDGDITDKNITPPRPNKKKARASPVKLASSALPTCMEELSEADKMMLDMRDRKKPWTEILQRWEEMTGTPFTRGGLTSRYTRVRASLQQFSAEDDALLLRLKCEMEQKFEKEKWNTLSNAIMAEGGKKFSNMALQKRFHELSKPGTGGL